MVRQKDRWLLVQFDFESNLLSPIPPIESSTSTTNKRKFVQSESLATSYSQLQLLDQVTPVDIFRSLQESLLQNFGLVASSTTDVSIRLYDPKVRLAIVKTSREKYPIVRSALSFVTQVKSVKVVASTIAVNGSSRTARNAAWKELSHRFFKKDGAQQQEWTKKTKREMQNNLIDLQERLEKVDSSC